MRVARWILGVVVGYAIFAVSAVLLFRLAGRDPHTQQELGFIIGAIVYGMVFGAIGGYVSAALGGGNPRIQGGVVGGVIALGATVSLIAGPHAGPMWSRVAALTLMAPSALAGGALRGRHGRGLSRTERH
jgi:hypothetical protein